MTLGQLAQELEKSANSLANTLRQVGLADRLLHESNIPHFRNSFILS